MTSHQIRATFLEYFRERGHQIIGSSPSVPDNDKTLLYINSGMAPLKSFFTREQIPPFPRLCNIQRCIRTNDIENVGDVHHLTFFEMMGNWSIGDYFKERAITFAWELMKDVYGFDTNRLVATFYGGDSLLPSVPADNESRRIWQGLIPNERVVPLGADSNFWGPTSKTGPCGPCTEVFIDRGQHVGCLRPTCGPDCGCGRFIEIWNAGVFMQYNMNEDRSLTELPMRSVDAGAGLDRFAMVLQGTGSVYETDLLVPIMETVRSSQANPPEQSLRIIADPIRCATFIIADGVRPANTRREYVLRRLIRQSVLHAKLANVELERLPEIAKVVVDLYKPYYPELLPATGWIEGTIRGEMTVFGRTLSRGLAELDKIITHSTDTISGEDVFRLYDTFGMPLEITRELVSERNMTIDEQGFANAMETQRKRSRQSKLPS